MGLPLEGLAMLALAGAVVYMAMDARYGAGLTWVRSTIDGHTYQVQDRPDAQAAADLLARIRERLDRLRRHLEKMAPKDPRTARIVGHFHSDRISEAPENEPEGTTSYSINKGEKIVFCLRRRGGPDAGKLEDINMMMFVAIHELAHIATEEVGHTPLFWENMAWLLEEAINTGVYTKQDFKTQPQKYCGVEVTSSPLD